MKPMPSGIQYILFLFVCGKYPSSVAQNSRLVLCYKHKNNCLTAVCCCSLLLSIAVREDRGDLEMAM